MIEKTSVRLGLGEGRGSNPGTPKFEILIEKRASQGKKSAYFGQIIEKMKTFSSIDART